MKKHSPPAFIDDLPQNLKEAWSVLIEEWLQKAIKHIKTPEDEGGHSIKQPYLFSILESPEAEAGPVKDIPWQGYPRKYALVIPDKETRWRLTESYVNKDLNGRKLPYYYLASGQYVSADDVYFRDQDEYCEWKSFNKPGANELEKVVFTCENPEYWHFIAENDKDLLLKKYSDLTGQEIQLEDLFYNKDIYIKDDSGNYINLRGQYNPNNKWNSTHHIIHLTHPANSLEAEIMLAADATVIRKKPNGKVITDSKELICCSGYGNANRSSDPSIGSKINALVRNNLSITLNDPVGLYIHSLNAGIDLPGTLTIDDCWKIIRGKETMILRAEFSLPPDLPYKMSDIKVGGVPLKYGSQLAELVNMVIYGRGFDFKYDTPTPKDCITHCCKVPSFPSLIRPIDIEKPCEMPLEMLTIASPLDGPKLTMYGEQKEKNIKAFHKSKRN